MRCRFTPILILSSLHLMVPAAIAQTVTLEPSKDNTLYEHPEGELSNGAGSRFFAGRTSDNASFVLRRGLIAFDLSDIPAGSTINEVSLTLNMTRTALDTERDVSLHRALSDWGEGASNAPGQEGAGDDAEAGDATWLHTFYPGSFWTSPGGDFSASPSATTAVGPEDLYTWSAPGMVADVQAWLDGAADNFGWIVIGEEGQNQTAKRFDAREGGVPPALEIIYSPAAGLGACCFPDGSCQLLEGDACTAAGGSGLGDGTTCDQCPDPSGACCLEAEMCAVLTEAQCLAQAGSYQGNGTNCDPNPCLDPTGACCFGDGTCQELTQNACAALADTTYLGDGTDCQPNPCPAPMGACCFSGGACEPRSAADCADDGGVYQGDGTGCDPNPCGLDLEPFVDPLPIPGVADPVVGNPGGEATYEIAMTQFQQQLHSDLPPTTVWGFAGGTPGPVIEATVGQPVTVTWINDLRDEQGELRTEHYLPVDLCPHGPNTAGNTPRTVVHLHGGHVAPQDDGYPEDTMLPGEQQTFFYPNMQLPGTVWFHDHALGITRLNVYMGMAGIYLLRDQFEADLGLPSGDFEIPLVIQDRSFNADGSLAYPVEWQDHFFGDYVMVNGKVWPFLEVRRGLYRFRLLNGSNSRVYTLTLSNGAPFQQIGTDGGLLPAPVMVSEITIAPGERADVVVDFSNASGGDQIFLENSAPAPFPGEPGVGVIPQVMKFQVINPSGDPGPLPETLRPIEVLSEDDAIRSRDFVLRKQPEECAGFYWLINDLLWDDITEYPQLGTTEIWAFINRSSDVHPMHMHLVFFQVLDRQDFELIEGEIVPVGPRVPPSPEEAGWKDTVKALPFQITRVIARFEDFTGLYPYHCHILEHEDHEMMRQFRVIPFCPADTNGDGVVNVTDLIAVISTWGTDDAQADVNDDGVVDVTDLVSVINAWGECPLE